MKYLIYANIFLYALPCIFYIRTVWKDIIMNIKDFIYYSPFYMLTLQIYAFCNVHDISWGTKGFFFFVINNFKEKQQNKINKQMYFGILK